MLRRAGSSGRHNKTHTHNPIHHIVRSPLPRAGHFRVDDSLDPRDVQPARRQVRADKHVCRAVLEPLQRLQALRLRE